MTEHQQGRIGRRKLDVIKPIVAAIKDVGFPGRDFDGEEEMRQFGVMDGFEPIRARLAARDFRRALAECARQESFVGVDGEAAPVGWEAGD